MAFDRVTRLTGSSLADCESFGPDDDGECGVDMAATVDEVGMRDNYSWACGLRREQNGDRCSGLWRTTSRPPGFSLSELNGHNQASNEQVDSREALLTTLRAGFRYASSFDEQIKEMTSSDICLNCSPADTLALTRNTQTVLRGAVLAQGFRRQLIKEEAKHRERLQRLAATAASIQLPMFAEMVA